MRAPTSNGFLIAVFLALIAGVPLLQTVGEARQGRRPQALDVFRQPPTQANLRAYEQELGDASFVARAVRPWVQAAQFFGLRDAGTKAMVGRDGWLFYRPGVEALTQRARPGESTVGEALAAVADYRDRLAARGIRLIVVPAPNKESVYPDRLARGAGPPAGPVGADARAFLAGCAAAGVETVDLFALFRDARAGPPRPCVAGERDGPAAGDAHGRAALYLAQDSHWSPAGLQLAAAAVAERIRPDGREDLPSYEGRTERPVGRETLPSAYAIRPVDVHRTGDLVRMLQSPPLEVRVAPELIRCEQVLRAADGTPYADDPGSDVLVLGDSFLRMYDRDEPGQAGFVAHLSRALGRPLASIVNDGGAATLVRQDLFRRPALLAGKKTVVWEFTERDLRLATGGWTTVPLPADGR